MDNNIPKELEETQLNLQVVVDTKTKCFVMKTHIEETPIKTNGFIPNIIANDPLNDVPEREKPIDFSKMNELERLIYTERERILNLRQPKKSGKKLTGHEFNDNSNHSNNSISDSDFSESDVIKNALSQNEKSKLRMRKLRERETSEERDYRRFRQRIVTLKIRLMQKINNFDDETYLKELSKKHAARIKEKRKQLKATETPEQRLMRKNDHNVKSRLRNMRRRAFKTPEELEDEKERRLSALEKYRARHTEEERSARQKLHREKARERYRKNNEELRKFDKFLKGAPLEILDSTSEK